jgi:hypothetical protein
MARGDCRIRVVAVPHRQRRQHAGACCGILVSTARCFGGPMWTCTSVPVDSSRKRSSVADSMRATYSGPSNR